MGDRKRDVRPSGSTKPIVIGAALVAHFVRISTYAECRVSLPQLTREQYEGIRAGRIKLSGDSSALTLEDVPADEARPCYACDERPGTVLGLVQGEPELWCRECHRYEYGTGEAP